MDKAVLVMDIPEFCSDPQMTYKHSCPLLDVSEWKDHEGSLKCGYTKEIIGCSERTSSCPLHPVPEYKEAPDDVECYGSGYAHGWNDCLRAVLEGKECDSCEISTEERRNRRYMLQSFRSVNGSEMNDAGVWYFNSKAEAWSAALWHAEAERAAMAKHCAEVDFTIREVWGEKIEISYRKDSYYGKTDKWFYKYEIKDNPGNSKDV